jgi:hypothetical protein
VSVEFVDFGIARSVDTLIDASVGAIIEEAGADLLVKGWMVQLARSGGSDIPTNAVLRVVPDRNSLVVYLRCVHKGTKDQLIMPVPTCDNLRVRNFTARFEVPMSHDVYTVTAWSTDRIGAALLRTPLKLDQIEQITYDGVNVTMDTPLEAVSFRDHSAFVVYLPCPSHTPSPSLTPSTSPSPSPTPSPTFQPSISPDLGPKRKARKLGAYDAYRHCKNARGDKIKPPNPESIGLDPASVDPLGKGTNPDFECEGSEMTDNEEPNLDDAGKSRGADDGKAGPHNMKRTPMIRKAVIMAKFEGRTIPVLVKPISTGVDIFDAIERATGMKHHHLVGHFMGQKINHYTKLKPLGFIAGDVVEVMTPAHVDEDDDDDKE